MSKINDRSLTYYSATVADLLGIDRPRHAEEPLPWVEDVIREMAKKPFDRLFVFTPDSFPQWMLEKNPDLLETLQKRCQVTIPVHSMRPSITPVAYSSIFTGAMPEVHGITQSKHPLDTDSLFDCLSRAGKKVAVITGVRNSMHVLWQEKNIDFYIEQTLGGCIDACRKLILEDEYDAIICYLSHYDSADHKSGPESPESMAVFRQCVSEYDYLAQLIEQNWTDHTTLLNIITDHGCHACEPSEKNGFHMGTHGSDLPEDQNILHFFGVMKGKNA